MPRSSNHYPTLFLKVPDAAHKLGEFSVELDSPSAAQSMKTHWYGYVRSLHREQSPYAIGASVVLVRVKGSTITFVDRNQDKMAKSLEKALEAQAPEILHDIEEEIALGIRNADGSLKEGFKR